MADEDATASRWARLDRRNALAVLALLLALIGASLWVAARSNVRPPPTYSTRLTPPPRANEDLILYQTIVRRVSTGENYYAVAADELRRGYYPLKPFVAFRLPTLAMAGAWLGRPALLILQYCLFVGMLAAWWVRFKGEFAVDRRRLSAVMLAAAGVAVAINGRYVNLHEVWAGALISLSLALHRPERWGWSVVAAAVALAIRELALPYVLLMGVLALWRRNWREFCAWAAVALLFGVVLLAHRAAVMEMVTGADPSSPGWATFAGFAGVLRAYHLGGALAWLPAVAAGPIIILSWFGWASWKSTTGLAGLLTILGYGLAFMLFGRPNNFYWGLIATPILLIGLAFVPRAISDLASATRREFAP